MPRLVLAAATWLALAAPALAAPPDLAGTYEVRGWNPGVATSGKASYGGTLTIAHAGDLLKVVWNTGGPAVEGVALVSDVEGQRILSVSYSESGHPAIAVYAVSTDGKKLDGRWGAQRIGHETATR